VQAPRIVTEQVDRESWVVALEGEHDLSTCDALQRECDRIFELGTCLIVDLSAATFVDSSILGALVSSHRRAENEEREGFAVVAPPGSAGDKLFRLAGAYQMLTIFQSRTDAVEWCGSSGALTD